MKKKIEDEKKAKKKRGKGEKKEEKEILPESEKYLPTRADPFLKATWTELEFRAEPRHFRNGQIKIKCQATIMAAQGKMGARYQSMPFRHSNSSFLLGKSLPTE
ncbi:hypothetical protein M8J77_008789 [Diaphorina citri]|nr:hypothetical protein M8J77_008789 [Diaphorina citri]